MKKITVVTGPLRSGTSCVTGLLELCGLDLGKNIRILRDPTEYNPKGHFEHDLLFTVNERLLIESGEEGAGVFSVPSEKNMAELADKREKYFNMFINRFDGNLCKDPLLCITLRYWETFWPELQRAVFCLRHPVAVALSMHERYGISMDDGVRLWETYTRRFFYTPRKTSVFIFDFDAFSENPLHVFSKLLAWLEISCDTGILQKHIDNFFLYEYAVWDFNEKQWMDVPQEIKNLYQEIKKLP